MAGSLPDVGAAAKELIEKAREGRAQFVDGPVERVCADAAWADPDALFSGLVEFHHERLERIPSAETYPEAQPWVEHRLAVEQELIKAGVPDWDRAVLGGLNDYLCYRGFRSAAKKRRRSAAGGVPAYQVEKCRVAYLPQTDEGPVFIKNVDDPSTFWKKDRTKDTFCKGLPSLWTGVRTSGVGSGLHLDIEPEELFPLPISSMKDRFCEDLPSTIEFFTRYCDFHSGHNFILWDNKGKSVAVEKCSRKHIDVFDPVTHGRSHASGMVCRDRRTEQAKHQRAMREEYVEITGARWNAKYSLDVAFWEQCDLAHRILDDFLNGPNLIAAEALLNLFITPLPKGLRKTGTRFHPDQAMIEYTLITYMALLDKRTAYRYQCDDPPAMTWPEEPEVYRL